MALEEPRFQEIPDSFNGTSGTHEEKRREFSRGSRSAAVALGRRGKSGSSFEFTGR